MRRRGCRVLLSLALILVLVCSSSTVFAAMAEAEYPLPRNAILYSEIEAQLKVLEAKNPKLMDYEVIGQSAGGKDLYLVTISDAAGMRNLEKYQKFMQTAVRDPEKARKALKGSDIKIPVFFNASIHGNETTGTDGILKLIDRLLTDNSTETRGILKNCVILINVCQNPDGRISCHRENSNGTDLNRDYITQSQPEVQAVVKNIAMRWFPTAMLDLHGFMNSDNILLEPCTIPHNPNYEYDLAIKYALPHAEAIAGELTALTKRDIDIPYEIWEDGWDDYPPIFTPQYFMYLGAIGHTLEVKFPDQEGVDSAYAASLASLNYVSGNKIKLLDNQFTIFERGAKGLNIENDVSFPEAYVIPMDADLQQDPLEAANMIRHLLTNKVIVQQADAAFTADGRVYPAGTFVVPMKQSLRGLANTMLWKGEDISDQASAMYDISCYSFPALCGFDAAAVLKSFTANLTEVSAAPVLRGTLETGTAKYYIMPVENNQAYKAANSLAKEGVSVYRTSEDNGSYAPGSFVIPNTKGITAKLEKLIAENAVNVKGITAVKGKLQPVRLQKTAVVGNDGGAVTAMKALGFDVTAIPYYSLNHGYDL
ncbi:MAG: M14 family zinc carboxypeptidase, partial [Eubacteriales bacterium]|nr:M14 family zinc carboxypeptidase [Eubacteriales bacterium]